ncbi:MAG: hypothetical protein KAS32_16570 [Candidatus Peribacteraceae bacterium]|nr:hypothetical protein [Candidatus Peribacteraceae bacterium]
MPVVITVRVASSAAAIADGYNSIKVYRSGYEDGEFLEVTTDSTRPVLTSTQIYYNFEDATGTSSSWYKTSYYHSVTLLESSLSTASKGIEIELEHVDTTYPEEINMTSTDYYHTGRIRYLVGDNKKVVRDYVSPGCTGGYQNVSEDGYTYQFEARGWPLRIEKDGVSYASSSNPYVTDYSFLTFSGTQINTVSGTLDIWYESFRKSDREILKVYNTNPGIPHVSSSAVTTEMLRLSSAISIIREELVQLMGENSGKFNLSGELSFDPTPILKHKRALIKDLESQLSVLVSESVSNNITGVLID